MKQTPHEPVVQPRDPIFDGRNPLVGLWGKRNTSSGHFDAIKRSGDVTKGVRREN